MACFQLPGHLRHFGSRWHQLWRFHDRRGVQAHGGQAGAPSRLCNRSSHSPKELLDLCFDTAACMPLQHLLLRDFRRFDIDKSTQRSKVAINAIMIFIPRIPSSFYLHLTPISIHSPFQSTISRPTISSPVASASLPLAVVAVAVAAGVVAVAPQPRPVAMPVVPQRWRFPQQGLGWWMSPTDESWWHLITTSAMVV